MKTNDNNKKNQKKDRTLPIVLASVSAFIILVVLASVFIPVISARAKLKEELRGFENMTDRDAMSLFDPHYSEGSFYGDVTVRIEGEERQSFADSLIIFADGAHYDRREQSLVGNWDVSISLRIDGGGIYTVYFKENGIYVAEDTSQYIFTVDDSMSEDYAEFYKNLERMIAENAHK